MRKNINHQLLVFRAVPVECKQCICNARIDACGRGKKMLNCSRDKNQVAHSSDGGRGIGEKCLLCDYPDLSYERRELEKYHGIGRRYRQLLLIIWYWYRMGEKSKKNRTRNRHYHRHHRHDVIINWTKHQPGWCASCLGNSVLLVRHFDTAVSATGAKKQRLISHNYDLILLTIRVCQRCSRLRTMPTPRHPTENVSIRNSHLPVIISCI